MTTVAYQTDYLAWTNEQANLLLNGQLSELDLQNLAEEIAEMGQSIRREFFNRMVILVMHLLKWQFQPAFRGRSWENTIRTQRKELTRLIRHNPSLKSMQTTEWYQEVWDDAIDDASYETGIPKHDFPSSPIWTVDEALQAGYLPEQP